MNEVEVFSFETKEVRTIVYDDEVWFVGKDVATTLGYKKPENAIATHVDDDDKTTTLIQGGGSNYKSKTTLVNESGLYSLIFGSKLTSAKRFKKWVTSEVLPSIRKNGSYQSKPMTAMETLQLQSKAILETNERLSSVEDDVIELKENALLPAGQYSYIVSRVNKRVNEVSRAFGKKLTQKQRGELYRDINSGIKAITGVKTRTQLQIKHFDLVDNFILDWEPSTSTKTLIRQTDLELGE